MKKTNKLVLCILIIALITLSSITAYAAMCSHGWEYWEVMDVDYDYEYIDSGVCYATITTYVECKICGTTGELMSYGINSHEWVREDLGHIPGTNMHRFNNTCNNCGYSFITEDFCSIPH
ncbi:MAG: hypothetical protein GXY21_04400 [Clostridiaceae bacterium]|nr:hypothetical protein [Clostridiaceae bacterium]